MNTIGIAEDLRDFREGKIGQEDLYLRKQAEYINANGNMFDPDTSALLETIQVIVLTLRKHEPANEWILNVIAKLILNELEFKRENGDEQTTEFSFDDMLYGDEFMSHVQDKISDYVHLKINDFEWINVLKAIASLNPSIQAIINSTKASSIDNNS